MSETHSRNWNSKYAWTEVRREDLPKRSAPERAADFLEVCGLYDEATAREQASRCIQCPNPTCVGGCPLCNPIPQWMQLTAEGRFLEAATALESVTNFAEICTRVCPSDHLCEDSCILGGISEPVSIRALEQFLADYALAHGQADVSTAPPNGLKVAVVGAGPGGLACAEELAKRGYSVTVFDQAAAPGGALVDAVPAFRLARSAMQRRLELLKKRGIVFELGAKLWQEITLGNLRARFDSIFLGFDSRKARLLQVPGADLKGVLPAVPFLLQQSLPAAPGIQAIELRGKRLLVIGGGDAAIDCLRSGIRSGAGEVTGVYLRGQGEMPCGRKEFEAAAQEGARFLFNVTPVALRGDPHGWVSGVRCARTVSVPGGFQIQSGSELEVPADLVVLALGFDPQPCPDTDEFKELQTNEWGGLTVDENQMTSIPGIFAGGDLVRGPTTLLYAVRDGRRAAEQIAVYLSARRA